MGLVYRARLVGKSGAEELTVVSTLGGCVQFSGGAEEFPCWFASFVVTKRKLLKRAERKQREALDPKLSPTEEPMDVGFEIEFEFGTESRWRWGWERVWRWNEYGVGVEDWNEWGDGNANGWGYKVSTLYWLSQCPLTPLLRNHMVDSAELSLLQLSLSQFGTAYTNQQLSVLYESATTDASSVNTHECAVGCQDLPGLRSGTGNESQVGGMV